MKSSEDTANWLKEVVQKFLDTSTDNSLKAATEEKAWDRVLLGFSRGDDPLYLAYQKKYVGPFHWTPLEAFNTAFPDSSVRPDELTVISWVLPQTEATKADNRKENLYPGERWARTRIFGQQANVKLHEHVVAVLNETGYPAMAPLLSPQWTQYLSEKYGFASNWSERHAAYAGGLGTFGLCDGLITPLGKAMRLGSVIARISIPPTPRPYTDHHAYCLFFSKGTCQKCIDRCPAGAISEQGKDKQKCKAYLWPVTEEYVKSHYGFDGYGCGLCQTKVPCESRIPIRPDVEDN
ncbi:MAG: epoxyqueuosine reductase [Deltaproteobacteria bacterium]|nr:epoxyqueuosine reductase [Deltaproteobacteria bacterium]